MVTLVARLDVESVHWVGTSMGGLIGMALAAQPGTPVQKLVLNDAGPVVTQGVARAHRAPTSAWRRCFRTWRPRKSTCAP